MKQKTALMALTALVGMLTGMPDANASSKKCPDTWDYVIVGGGTAGATLAAKLSDPDSHGKFKNSVLVLELGIDGSDDPSVLAANLFLAAGGVSNDPAWTRWTETTTFGSIQYFQSEGVMVGGSAGHNGLQWFRATPDIYNQWAAISGNSDWNYSNLLNNVLIPIESYTPNGNSATNERGLNGPLFVSQEPPVDTDPVSIAISTASLAPLVDDVNDLSNGDVGVSANQDTVTPPFGSPNSIRSYAGNSFLRGIPSMGIAAIVDANGNGLGGRKLKIITNAHGNRVLFSKAKHGKRPKAEAVEYFLSNEPDKLINVNARKKVILATGSLYDPAMLQRSGIGDAALLDSLDIPVVFDNPNVGANLQNHVGFEGVIALPTDISFPSIGNAFIGLPSAPEERTFQLIYTNALGFVPLAIRELLDLTEGTVFVTLDEKPNSRGTVEILSANPLRQPRVSFNNFSDGGPSDPGSDANKVVEFYLLLQDIAADAGSTVLYPTPAQYADGDDALFQAGLASFLEAFHMSGTCSMATSADTGVVDGDLNVFGVKNLMVVSNAVAPVISDANTGLQAYVIGYQAARILRGE